MLIIAHRPRTHLLGAQPRRKRQRPCPGPRRGNAVNILSEPRIFTSDNQRPSSSPARTSFYHRQPAQQQRQPRAVLRLQSRRHRPPRPSTHHRQSRCGHQHQSPARQHPARQHPLRRRVVDRRETTTHLIVKDGQTVVISGILRTEDNDTKRESPAWVTSLVGSLFTSVRQHEEEDRTHRLRYSLCRRRLQRNAKGRADR